MGWIPRAAARSMRLGGAAGLVLASVVALRAQEIIISEFLAVNSDGIRDEDGDRSDWIEVQNVGSVAVDLEGWSLTDDPVIAGKWHFPARVLESGEILVVFASGKNRVPAAGELHTNFQVAGAGEYIALARPDESVADHYPPPLLPQFDDVSYGVAQVASETSLVGPNAVAAYRVPVDGSAGTTWTQAGFNDAAWSRGPGPIGFDTDGGEVVLPGEERNLALAGAASQSSTGFGGVASRAIDGNKNPSYGGGSITHTNDEAGGWWEVDLGAAYGLSRIVLWNRSDCCAHRLSNFRVSVLDAARAPVAESDHFTDEDFPATPSYEIALPAATRGRFVRIARLGPDPEGGNYVSLAEVEVFEGIIGLGSAIGTDIEGAMAGVGSSAYVRHRFDLTAADIDDIEFVTLRVRYDDGFVAYLNGTRVAARNAPATPAWSSIATAERDDADAIVPEAIALSSARDLLVAGANVLAVHALNLSQDDGDLILGVELAARRVAGTSRLYFTEPTPGTVNDTPGVAGFVADTRFSHDRGFYDAPFDLTVTSATPGAVVRFTTDGSVPTETRGNLAVGPIRIAGTTTVRAAAFRAGLVPTNVDTQTFVFLDQVIASPVMNRTITTDARYAPQMRAALTDLPSISFVTPAAINGATEVPVSMELLPSAGSPGFQIDAGVKHYGGAFTEFAKKNFRLYFRGEYGATKLEYPLFDGHDRGIPAVEEFDQLELRSGSHDMNQRGFYMSNRFTDDTMLDMGNINPHGRFVHLYVNGVYWGQFHLRERWNASMLAEYLGGQKEDYEAINGNWNVGGWPDPGVPYDGDGSTWTRIKTLRNDYEAIDPLLDVQSYVDFMLMFMFGNSEDEYRCVGPTVAGTGFKFFLNDADGFTRDGGNRTAMGRPGRQAGDGPGSIFSMLLAEGHPDYRTLLGDRIHAHFFNDGAMTPAKNAARLLERCSEVERPFIAEAARWGYRTPASWESAKSSYVNGILPTRTATVINQYRAAGFYPAIEAPVLNRHGGVVSPGFVVALAAPRGSIYFTSDGSDPRLAGGALSPAARLAGAVETTALVEVGAEGTVHVPANGALGTSWTAVEFNDSSWTAARTGIGFERATGFEPYIETDIDAAMYGVNASVYLRIPFDVTEAATSLELQMRYDDGFIAYLNGTEVASRNAPDDATWSSGSTGSHVDSAAIEFENIDISDTAPPLRIGRNVLAIHGFNTSPTSNDLLFAPRLVVTLPAGGDGAGVVRRSTRIQARARSGNDWSALTAATFLVGTGDLRVTEVLYHPPSLDGDELDRDEHEFIEIQNTGNDPVHLYGARFTKGILFDFPASPDPATDLAPGEAIVLVRNLEAFATRYDVEAIAIAGEYAGRLDNAGERIVLSDALGNVILDFAYSDTWIPETDGGGSSLEIIDADAAPATWGVAASWRAGPPLGTPGFHDSSDPADGGLQRQGDLNQDAVVNVSDAVALLVHLFVRPRALPCGASLDDAGNRALVDVDGDGAASLTDAIYLLDYLFKFGPPPALGVTCQRIPGCPDACAPRPPAGG